MQINSNLDLRGNELKNFLLQDVDTKDNAHAALAGRLVYDSRESSPYIGVLTGNQMSWKRIMTNDSILPYISNHPTVKWANHIMTASVEFDHQQYPLAGTGVLAQVLQYGINAYEWGNHKNEGYARSFSVIGVGIDESANISAEKLTAENANDYSGHTLVYDYYKNRLLVRAVRREVPPVTIYFKEWDDLGDNELLDPMSRKIKAYGYYHAYGTIALITDEQGVEPFGVAITNASPFESNVEWHMVTDNTAKAFVEELYASGYHEEDVVYRLKAIDEMMEMGDHRVAGYTRSFKIGESEHELPTSTSDTLSALNVTQEEGWTKWKPECLVLNSRSKTVLCRCYRETTGTLQRKQNDHYIRYWYGENDKNGQPMPDSDEVNNYGAVIYVQDDASIWLNDGGFFLVYKGANQDIITKIDDIADALGIGREDGTSIVDTWNEMKAFFSNIDNSESLLSVLATKANKDDVLPKPEVGGSYGDVLTYNPVGDSTMWTKKKITKSSKDRDGNHIVNGEWIVDITDLYTMDVTVTLYKKINSFKYEQVLADMYVETYDTDEGTQGTCVRFVFGRISEEDVFKVVIIS